MIRCVVGFHFAFANTDEFFFHLFHVLWSFWFGCFFWFVQCLMIMLVSMFFFGLFNVEWSCWFRCFFGLFNVEWSCWFRCFFIVCSVLNDHVGFHVFLVCSMFNDHVGFDVFWFVQMFNELLVWMFLVCLMYPFLTICSSTSTFDESPS
jgi:hypothetical protein